MTEYCAYGIEDSLLMNDLLNVYKQELSPSAIIKNHLNVMRRNIDLTRKLQVYDFYLFIITSLGSLLCLL